MAKVRGYTAYRGYCWKLCPYSTAYKTKYYDNGWAGNTNNPDITQSTFSTIVTDDHPDTEGTMNMKTNGGSPGWICLDDNCPFLTDNGYRYFEV